MRPTPTRLPARSPARPLAALALALTCALPGSASATTRGPGPAARPQPCPGTTAPGVPAPTRPAGPAPRPTAAPSSRPAPARPTPTSAPLLPPPVVPHRDVVVGGPALAGSGLVVDLPAGVPAPPALDATSWVIADATTGDVVAAKAPHAPLRPASTIKALTALTLLPRIGAGKVVVGTDEDMRVDGTKVGLVTGNRYPAATLFQAMLMASANDAVHALTRAYPGGRPRAVADVNALARDLGAMDTVVKDPSGLDAPGQVSSAYDLALVGRAALASKPFRTYSTTRTATFPGARMADGRAVPPFAISNHNRLLFNYPGTVGIKNGYTTLAHGTFVAAASRGGRTYLLTYMCSDRIGWRQMAASLDWAFAHGRAARPVGRLVERGSLTATPRATPAVPPTPVEPPGSPETTPSEAAPEGATAAAPVAAASQPTGVGRWWGAGVLAAVILLVGVLWRPTGGSTRRRQRPRG